MPLFAEVVLAFTRGDMPFNPMVQWMGHQLRKLDPALKGDERVDQAQRAAWNALGR